MEWADARLELSDATSLSNFLMEHAREVDESAKLEKRLLPLSRYVVPALHPDAATSQGLGEIVDDLRVVWGLCDGRSTIDELSASCLLGRARTLEALDRLRRKGCVDLCPAPLASTAPTRAPQPPLRPTSRPPVDFERLHSQYRDTSILRALIESFIGNMPGWLAELDGAASRADRAEYARLAGHIVGASGAVAAVNLLELASEAQTAAFEPDADLFGPLERVENAYAATFRELLSIHASG